jgi:hypothetical protein
LSAASDKTWRRRRRTLAGAREIVARHDPLESRKGAEHPHHHAFGQRVRSTQMESRRQLMAQTTGEE